MVMPGWKDGCGGDFFRHVRIAVDTVDMLAGRTLRPN
jgi:hypothetical protein